MRFVYRHFPLISVHDKAQIASEAADAAGAQDKFWEMHDILFEHQSEWSALSEANIIDTLVGYAEEIDLADIKQFRADLENDTYADKIMADYDAAIGANMRGTPGFVINQVDYPAQSFGLSPQGVETFISLIKLRDDWFEGPEQVIDPDNKYTATIETENGDIVVELYADTAPLNVNSFVFLAQQDWYKDLTFHRVIPD
ncbi:MAG: thioredoxin domain-containing protein, partial [bacterium]|nr:thioredoxin domain-containing protein [bacterium]